MKKSRKATFGLKRALAMAMAFVLAAAFCATNDQRFNAFAAPDNGEEEISGTETATGGGLAPMPPEDSVQTLIKSARSVSYQEEMWLGQTVSSEAFNSYDEFGGDAPQFIDPAAGGNELTYHLHWSNEKPDVKQYILGHNEFGGYTVISNYLTFDPSSIKILENDVDAADFIGEGHVVSNDASALGLQAAYDSSIYYFWVENSKHYPPQTTLTDNTDIKISFKAEVDRDMPFGSFIKNTFLGDTVLTFSDHMLVLQKKDADGNPISSHLDDNGDPLTAKFEVKYLTGDDLDDFISSGGADEDLTQIEDKLKNLYDKNGTEHTKYYETNEDGYAEIQYRLPETDTDRLDDFWLFVREAEAPEGYAGISHFWIKAVRTGKPWDPNQPEARVFASEYDRVDLMEYSLVPDLGDYTEAGDADSAVKESADYPVDYDNGNAFYVDVANTKEPEAVTPKPIDLTVRKVDEGDALITSSPAKFKLGYTTDPDFSSIPSDQLEAELTEFTDGSGAEIILDTGTDGEARLYFEKTVPDEFYIAVWEHDAPDGYIKNEAPVWIKAARNVSGGDMEYTSAGVAYPDCVTVDLKINLTEITMINKEEEPPAVYDPDPVSLSITKIDSESKQPITESETVFKLGYTNATDYETLFPGDLTQYPAYLTKFTDGEGNEITLSTESDGIAELERYKIEDIDVSKPFYIAVWEHQAPEGYNLMSDPVWIEAAHDENGKIAYKSVGTAPEAAQVKIFNDQKLFTIRMENEKEPDDDDEIVPAPVSLAVEKRDENNELITESAAIFNLGYTAADDYTTVPLGALDKFTDENGEIILTTETDGKAGIKDYTIGEDLFHIAVWEAKAPENYIGVSNPVWIEAAHDANGKITYKSVGTVPEGAEVVIDDESGLFTILMKNKKEPDITYEPVDLAIEKVSTNGGTILSRPASFKVAYTTADDYENGEILPIKNANGNETVISTGNSGTASWRYQLDLPKFYIRIWESSAPSGYYRDDNPVWVLAEHDMATGEISYTVLDKPDSANVSTSDGISLTMENRRRPGRDPGGPSDNGGDDGGDDDGGEEPTTPPTTPPTDDDGGDDDEQTPPTNEPGDDGGDDTDEPDSPTGPNNPGDVGGGDDGDNDPGEPNTPNVPEVPYIPGGNDPVIPPAPSVPGRTLVPSDDGGFIEIGEDGVPLGEWEWDDDNDEWVFIPEEPTPTGDYPADAAEPEPVELPKTDAAGMSTFISYLIGLMLIAAGALFGIKERKTGFFYGSIHMPKKNR